MWPKYSEKTGVWILWGSYYDEKLLESAYEPKSHDRQKEKTGKNVNSIDIRIGTFYFSF